MTRSRKFLTKKMLTDQMNEASQDEDNVALSNTKETEKKQRKRKKDCEEKNKKKRKKDCEEKHETKEMELAWKPEDCAKPLGEVSKVTGKGKKKKSHFKTFTFRGNQYALVSFVLRFDLLL